MKLTATKVDITCNLELTMHEVEILDRVCGYYSSVAKYVAVDCWGKGEHSRQYEEIEKVLLDLWNKTKIILDNKKKILETNINSG